jgi:hypothetical protein
VAPQFEVGEAVFVKEFPRKHSDPKYIAGVIIERTAAYTYRIKLRNEDIIYRHVDHIKMATGARSIQEEAQATTGGGGFRSAEGKGPTGVDDSESQQRLTTKSVREEKLNNTQFNPAWGSASKTPKRVNFELPSQTTIESPTSSTESINIHLPPQASQPSLRITAPFRTVSTNVRPLATSTPQRHRNVDLDNSDNSIKRGQDEHQEVGGASNLSLGGEGNGNRNSTGGSVEINAPPEYHVQLRSKAGRVNWIASDGAGKCGLDAGKKSLPDWDRAWRPGRNPEWFWTAKKDGREECCVLK